MWSGTCTPVSLCRTCRLHTHSFLAICCTQVSLWLIPFWFNTSHTTLVSAWLQLCWLSQCHMAIVLHLLATWVLSTTTPPASMLPPWLAKLTGFSSRVTWRHFISECSWIFLTQFPMSCLYSRAPFIQCKAKVRTVKLTNQVSLWGISCIRNCGRQKEPAAYSWSAALYKLGRYQVPWYCTWWETFDLLCWSGIYWPRKIKAEPDLSFAWDKFSVRYKCYQSGTGIETWRREVLSHLRSHKNLVKLRD